MTAMKKTVISGHTASYTDPICLRQGDILSLGDQDDWDGHIWLWATATNSKSGWVPDSLPQIIEGQTVSAYDYSAIELTVEAGDVVIVKCEGHGWAWCASAEGNEGWVPLRNLGERLR